MLEHDYLVQDMTLMFLTRCFMFLTWQNMTIMFRTWQSCSAMFWNMTVMFWNRTKTFLNMTKHDCRVQDHAFHVVNMMVMFYTRCFMFTTWQNMTAMFQNMPGHDCHVQTMPFMLWTWWLCSIQDDSCSQHHITWKSCLEHDCHVLSCSKTLLTCFKT